MNKNKELVKKAIDKAVLILRKEDLDNIIEFYENNERGLALETMIDQLYEYEIKIDKEIYQLIEDAALSMGYSKKKLIIGKNLYFSRGLTYIVQQFPYENQENL